MKTSYKKLFILIAVIAALLALFCVFAFADECQHVYSEDYRVIVEATCKSTGIEAQVCTLCGEANPNDQRVIPMKDHNYITVRRTEATCSAQGYVEYRCPDCGSTKEETLDYLPHTLENWTVTKNPTCKEEGEEKAICSSCGAPKTRPIDKLPHTEKTLEAVAPTCTECGKTEGVVCSKCWTVIVPQTRINPLGHDFGEPVVDEEGEATCTEKGVAHCFCSRCDATLRVEIPKIDHVDEDGDGLCDVCSTNMLTQECGCFCHYDTLAAIFTRYFDTLISSITKQDRRCCDDMEPLTHLLPEIFAYISRTINGTINDISEKISENTLTTE